MAEPLVSDEADSGFREVFTITKVNSSPLRANVAHRDPDFPGFISCTMPFTLPNGSSFVAIGCSEGVWVADPSQPDFLQRVVILKGVTEFAIIEAYSLLLILADKVLYCYDLEALDPHNDFARISHKLSSPTVDFFRVGMCTGRLVVVYKKRSMKNSVFRVLEPLFGRPPPGIAEPLPADFGPDRVYWFRQHKEFYVPAECRDIIFLKTNVAVLHSRGFEIVDMETFSTVTIPNTPLLDKPLAKRCKTSKPLGLLRAQNGTILLCYNTFGLFVTASGDPLPTSTPPIIDWHGTADAVVSAPPYIILFKARAIEVRWGTSGKLEQVLFGNGMRCTWSGGPAGAGHHERLIQIVMNVPHGMGPGEVAQHVYDLVPAPVPQHQ